MGDVGDTLTNLGSDFIGMMTGGIIDAKNMRINVPGSSAQMRAWGKSIGNFYTGEQFRDEINHALDSPVARTIGTIAGAIEGVVVGVGVGALVSGAATAGSAAAGAGEAAAGAGEAAAGAGAGAAEAAGTGAAEAVAPTAMSAGSDVIGAATSQVPKALPQAIGSAGSGSADIGLATGQAVKSAPSPLMENVGTQTALRTPTTVSNAPTTMAGDYNLSNTFGQGAGDLRGGMNSLKSAFSNMPVDMGSNAGSAKNWWDKLDPLAKGLLLSSATAGGMQVIGGAMSGALAGASAEQKLALEKLINDQRQNQVQYLNKNNQYAPLVTFGGQAPGVMNTAGRA